MLFSDRADAGRRLALHLRAYAHQPAVLVLALPRGGVPVALEVARVLKAPLDVFLVRKLGVPGYDELAMGALASGGAIVLNSAVISSLHIPQTEIEEVVVAQTRELERREQAYRDDQPFPVVKKHTVILIDDGLATGSTMRAAVIALRQQQPARLVVGVPVAPPETCAEIRDEVDDIICAVTPEPFVAVGRWYTNFEQVTDEDVRSMLQQSATWHHRHETPHETPHESPKHDKHDTETTSG